MSTPNRRRFLARAGAATALFGGAAALRESPAVAATPPPTSIGQANRLRIALMQAEMQGPDQSHNLARAEAHCRDAAAHGADLLLMPEMWNINYNGFNTFDDSSTRRWVAQAVRTSGNWVGRFRELAKELEMAIAVTYLESTEDGARNTVSVIDRHGELQLTYGKVHTCDFAFEAALIPGDGWRAADLDTAKGTVRIGAMICFDREFPESARSLMLSGAEVVVTPNACLLDDLRIAQFQVRAFENAMVMAMANYATPPLLNGRSVVFDATGRNVVEADAAEGLHYADIDLPAMRDYRSKTLWGNAWRRPRAYSDLTRDADIEVFDRHDAYGKPFNPSS